MKEEEIKLLKLNGINKNRLEYLIKNMDGYEALKFDAKRMERIIIKQQFRINELNEKLRKLKSKIYKNG